MTAPLLNDDKISFIGKRILSTVTGWRLSYKLKDNVLQFILFFVPWTVAGLLELLLHPLDFYNIHLIWIGVIFGIACLSIKLFSIYHVKPRWIDILSIILASILYGFFQVFATVYLSFASFQSVFVTNGTQITFYVLTWISVNVAQLVLLRGYIPAPDSYCAEHNEWDNATRTLYLTIMVSCFALQPFYSVLATPNYYLHYLVAFFPLITLAGFLPRFDIFVLYAFEMLSNIFLGIGPHQTVIRSVVDFVLSGLSLIIFSLLQEYVEGTQAILFLGIIATLLSSSTILDLLCGQKAGFSKRSLLSLFARISIVGILIGFKSYVVFVISSICLVFITLIFATSEVQQELVPSIMPVFHNPLKEKIRTSKSIGMANFSYFLGSLHFSSMYLAPIFISVWIASSYVEPLDYYSFSFSDRLLLGIYHGLFYIRALRYTWQNVRKMGIDIFILCIYTSIYNGQINYQAINPPLLFLIALFRQATFNFMGKMWFWGLSLVHFLSSKKHVLELWYLYLIPAILISPISVALSAILNAPVMPLVGLPIFWMGFLRPKRMWPNIETTCSIGDEAKIYAALCPSLLNSISRAISMGRIFPLEQGDVLIARFESRIFMIRCLESSFEYTKVIVMGAELEPTSCHSLEGTELDSVLDDGLNPFPKKNVLNRHFFHTVLPLDIVLADAYSESKLVTTGILDSNESLALIPIIYFKVLVHDLMKGLDAKSFEVYKDPPIHSAILANCWKKFPIRWFEYVQIHSRNVFEKSSDQDLMMIATACYVIMLGISSPSDSEVRMTLNSVFELYHGDLPRNTQIDVRNWFLHPSRIKLREICLQSIRSTIKLTIDQAIEGEPESLGELLNILETYSKKWLITIDPLQIGQNDILSSSKTCEKALNSEIPNLFFLSRKKDGVISVRLLTKQPCPIKIARINKEAVIGIWSNLVLEMLYITNDDDERYSIQAHETLLRNITIQLASPPFGYPIWTSHCILRHDGILSTDQYNYKRISPEF